MNENINALLKEFKSLCEEEENTERLRELNKSIVSYYKRNGLTESENFACHLYNLSLFYLNSENFSAALKNGKTALSIAQKRASSKLEAKFSDNLGIIYSCLGDKGTGLYWLKKGWGIMEKAADSFSDDEMCSAVLNLGSSLSENRRHADALRYHKKALKLKKEKDLEYANILNLIGYDYENISKYEEAAKYLRSALDILEKFCYDDDDDYIANIVYIANVYKLDGDFEMALTSYEKAVFLMKKAGLSEEPFFGEVLNKTAELYSDMGNDKKAVDLRREALVIFEKRIGNKNIFYANCLKELSDIYYRNEVYGTAISYLQRTLDIKSSVMSLEDGDYLEDFMRLAEAYDKNGQWNRAEEVYEYLLANISEKLPAYRNVIFRLAAGFRTYEEAEKLYDLYDKYKRIDPTVTFDEFLIIAETLAEKGNM